MINNRQAGRRRGRGGNNNGNGPRAGGGGQRDTGNRIDNRARGNANQLYEKYKNLAADSQRSGDRVTTEYYLQFADHYFRVLSESRSRFEEQNQRQQRDGGYEARPFTGSFDTGFDNQDEDYADEGEPIRPGEQQGREQQGREQGGEQQGFEPRAAREDRDDRRNGAGQQPRREDRPREDRQREDRQREDRNRFEGRRDEQGGERAPREAALREDGEGRRPRRNRDEARAPLNGEGTEAPAPVEAAAPVEAPAVAEAPAPVAEAPAPEVPAAEGEAPRRRGRPRRERPAEDAPAMFDATTLPPSLGIAPAATEAAGEGEEKPRRRRVRAAPPAEAGQPN